LVIIREIEYDDIDKGFLEVLDNLLSPYLDTTNAKNILRKIISNPLHKIFVAHDKLNNKIVGTTTLFIEPKFINKGRQIGYIEDVSVRKGYEGLGIGFKLVNYATNYASSNEDQKNIVILFWEKCDIL
jgi:glucosamine-phosphate N-acetyltransferase